MKRVSVHVCTKDLNSNNMYSNMARPKGYPAWNKGKPINQWMSKEKRELRNKKISETHIEKYKKGINKCGFKKGHHINLGKKGHIPWNKGKKLSKEHKEKVIKTLTGRGWNKGLKYHCHSEEWKKHLKERFSGDKNPMWNGGHAYDPYPFNFNKEFKKLIKTRDGFKCKLCGKNHLLSIHHVNYNKKNCNPENLITLCRNCHSKTNSNREYYIKLLSNLLK